ncbi:MAG TPA: hypothetical protein VJ728_00080, partial [Candidatus Binataceae bacterium]|nr:hypothetical protein [Candidatus Binataceae bacterium]
DLSRREIAVMVPLLALMFFMGLYPEPLLNRMEPSVDAWLARIHSAQAQSHSPRTLASSTVRGELSKVVFPFVAGSGASR